MLGKWYINGVELTGRGVFLKTGYSASCASISRSVYSSTCALYVATKASIGLKTIKIPIRIVRDTTLEADSVRSWLLSQCLDRHTEIFLPNGKRYCAAITKAQNPEKQAEGIIDFTLEFSGFERGDLTEANTPTVYCVSTVPETPYKITGAADTDGSFEMAGVTFTDCAQNDVIVIDGLSGLITINGVAADMSKNDFISFPMLTPGENTVVCDTVAEIEYYPIYL